jgi:hypothetical protein
MRRAIMLAAMLLGACSADEPVPDVVTPDDVCGLAIALCPGDAYAYCASDIQWCLDEAVSPADREWWEQEAVECMEQTHCFALIPCIDQLPACGWYPGEGLQP